MLPYRKPFIRTEHHPFKTCSNPLCPICTKSIARFKVKDSFKDEFFGDAPAPFIGHVGYPNLNVGVLSVSDVKNAELYDAPRQWAASNLQIPQIVDYRSALINSRFKANIKQVGKLINITQEVGLAATPVEMEIKLKEKPRFRLNIDAFSAPSGASAALKKAEITSNPKIPQKAEKVFSDTDLKARDALTYLYKHDFDENFLTRMLSVGTMGLKPNRKLVPTRFSITAVDDTLGKNFIDEIKQYPTTDYLAFFGGYLGNYFLIMFFPDVWGYELFESALGNDYMTDYEAYEGRKSYATSCGGGYYSSRLPIVEKLATMKRQASVLVLRFITPEYTIPLGVFVVRESVRKALNNKPIEFGSKELMLQYAKIVAKKRFNFNANILLNNSKLLKNMKSQKKLTSF